MTQANEITKAQAAELKRNILVVLRAQYKKDEPAAFIFVEAAGYEIYKYDGQWVVKNRQTWKSVRLDRRGKISTTKAWCDPEKVDIIAYLSKPYNHLKEEREYCPSRRKINDIKWAKSWLDTTEKRMEKLLNELDEARQSYMNATKDLMKEKAKYGLLK